MAMYYSKTGSLGMSGRASFRSMQSWRVHQKSFNSQTLGVTSGAAGNLALALTNASQGNASIISGQALARVKQQIADEVKASAAADTPSIDVSKFGKPDTSTQVFDNGMTIDYKTNIMTMPDGTRFDLRTGLPVTGVVVNVTA